MGTAGELNFPTREWFLKQGIYRTFATPGIILIDRIIEFLEKDNKD